MNHPSIDTVRQTTHLGPEVVKLLRSYEARIADLEAKLSEVEDRLPEPDRCSSCGGNHDSGEC